MSGDEVDGPAAAFNHLSLHDDGRPCNPLINAGAILTHALLPAESDDLDALRDRH